MLKNFFRKDLNLRNKRWHRLLLVVFLVSFLISIVYSISTHNPSSDYKQVATLNDRMSTKPTLIKELIRPNERIGTYESEVSTNLYENNGGWLLNQKIYCASDIENHIGEFATQNNVKYFKGNDAYLLPTSQITLEEFKQYILDSGSKCITKGSVKDYQDKDRVWSNIDYAIERSFFADDMNLYEIDTTKSISGLVINILLIVLAYLIALAIYYKAILYIVFGTPKN